MDAAAPQAQPVSLPDGRTLTLQFIDQAIAEHRLQAAAELLNRAMARPGGAADRELQLRTAELLLASGLLPDAERAFQALLPEADVAARARTGLAISLINRGEAGQARILLQEAVAMAPDLARAWSALAVLADRAHNWSEAEGHYDNALRVAPDDAGIWNNRGYSRLLQQDFAGAEADFQQALQLQPKLTEAQTNLRLARALQGQYLRSFANSRAQNLGQDLNTVGFAAMLRGDHALAESYFYRAMEADPAYQDRAAANLAYLKAVRENNNQSAGMERR